MPGHSDWMAPAYPRTIQTTRSQALRMPITSSKMLAHAGPLIA